MSTTTLQWYQNVRAIGYEHTVVLTENREGKECAKLSQLEPNIGCAWITTEVPAGVRSEWPGSAGQS